MCTVLTLSDWDPVAPITTRAHQPVWDEWYRLSAMETWEGMVDKSTAAEEKTYFDKRGASPRPLKHGQASKGGCTQP